MRIPIELTTLVTANDLVVGDVVCVPGEQPEFVVGPYRVIRKSPLIVKGLFPNGNRPEVLNGIIFKLNPGLGMDERARIIDHQDIDLVLKIKLINKLMRIMEVGGPSLVIKRTWEYCNLNGWPETAVEYLELLRRIQEKPIKTRGMRMKQPMAHGKGIAAKEEKWNVRVAQHQLMEMVITAQG